MIYFETDGKTLPKVTYAGRVNIGPPNKHFPRKPVEYIIYYITKGHINLMEGDICYSLSEGDLLILDPTRSHDGLLTMSEVSYIYVHFLADINELDFTPEDIRAIALEQTLSDESSERLIFRKLIHVQDRYRSEVKSLMESIVNNMLQKVPYYRTLCSLSLIELWTYLSHFDESVLGKENTALKLIRFIENNYHHKLSSELFEKEFNLNYDYLNRLYSVQEVAKQFGFANEFYFSRVYKKIEGHAPSDEIK